jgi:pilus assembly protein Flp/PilA
MKIRWLHFPRAREGATAIEYALIAALLSVVAITSVHTLGAKVNSHFGYISNAIN